MSTPLRQIIDLLEAEYPASWGVKGDHCGWELGQPHSSIDTVLVALEVTPAIVREAQQRQAQLLLTHHPLLYLPPASLREDEPVAHLVGELIRGGIALVSCHTNLDVAPGGINDYLAQRLGLGGVQVLAPTSRDAYFKLVVFVPADYEDRVRQALGDAGLGIIGRYAQCSFSGPGQGTYVPLEGAQPFQGEAAKLNCVEERRLEMLAPASRLEEALARLRQVHPYEEVAYDLYPLRRAGVPLGLGRSGFWPEPKSFSQVIDLIKEIFGSSAVRLWGRPPGQVERVALCSGSGGDLISTALKSGAQLYLTGEVRHHQWPAGEFRDFAVAEVGHFASEAVFMAPWASRLQELFQQAGWNLQVRAAADQAAPYEYL
jgi:dinuclear metal center YbgI/SA1388 family protein